MAYRHPLVGRYVYYWTGDAMKFQGIISEKDYIKAIYLHMKPRLSYLIFGIVLLLLILIVLIISSSWVIIFCWLVLFGYFFIYLPKKAKQKYKEYKQIQTSNKFELKENGIYCESLNGNRTIEWNEILKTKNNNKLFLIYSNNSLYHIFSSHFFENKKEFDRFIQIINQGIIKHNKSLKTEREKALYDLR